MTLSQGRQRWTTGTAFFIASLLLGSLLRLAVLPLPGTGDVTILKTWSHGATSLGASQVYGQGGERAVLEYGERRKKVNYPPLSLYLLALIGQLYRAYDPSFRDSLLLTALVKAPAVAADAGLATLLFAAVRRTTGDLTRARWCALAHWLNPAVLVNGALLGYWDPLLALPCLGALVAADRRRSALAGALVAAAVLIKPQAVFVGPAVLLAARGEPGARRRAALLRAAAAGLLVAALVVLPIVAAGGGRSMAEALASLGGHDMLSADAANLWWLATWVKRAVFPEAGDESPVRLTTPVRILRISTLTSQGYPNPRPFATAVLLLAAAWGAWRAWRVHGLVVWCGLSAFIVHAYFVLAVGVHENHLFLAVPLLALVAAIRERYRALLWATSAIVTLNLHLLYGFGLGVGHALPRSLTLIDMTVWLALASVVTLVWHARAFAALCAESHAEAAPYNEVLA